MITDIILLFLMIIIGMVSSGRGYNIAKKDNRKSDGYLYLYIVLFMVFWTIYLSKPMRAELSSKNMSGRPNTGLAEQYRLWI